MLHDQGHITAKLLSPNATAGLAIGTPILLGRPDVIAHCVDELGLHLDPQVVDPNTDARRAAYAEAYYQLRQRRVTVMIATHDSGSAAKSSNMVVCCW